MPVSQACSGMRDNLMGNSHLFSEPKCQLLVQLLRKKKNKLTNFKGTYNKADVSLDLLVAESSGENQFLCTG